MKMKHAGIVLGALLLLLPLTAAAEEEKGLYILTPKVPRGGEGRGHRIVADDRPPPSRARSWPGSLSWSAPRRTGIWMGTGWRAPFLMNPVRIARASPLPTMMGPCGQRLLSVCARAGGRRGEGPRLCWHI